MLLRRSRIRELWINPQPPDANTRLHVSYRSTPDPPDVLFAFWPSNSRAEATPRRKIGDYKKIALTAGERKSPARGGNRAGPAPGPIRARAGGGRRHPAGALRSRPV